MRFSTMLTIVAIICISGYTYMKMAQDTKQLKAVKHVPPSQTELNYRQCLRIKAGSVGVTSLDQMQKCKEDTGYDG